MVRGLYLRDTGFPFNKEIHSGVGATRSVPLDNGHLGGLGPSLPVWRAGAAPLCPVSGLGEAGRPPQTRGVSPPKGVIVGLPGLIPVH